MNIPYRTRMALGRLAVALLVVLLVGALIWAGWVFWLSRFVIYTQDGAKIDFSLSENVASGEIAIQPEPGETVVVSYNDAGAVATTELGPLIGYYVEDSALSDIAKVKADIQALPAGTAIMVNVKNIRGGFYYSSAVSQTRSSNIDTAAMDELIGWLKKSGMYTIACVPALRDREYGLNHTVDGIHHSSRGYLWMDDQGCYWLNPASGSTLSYLTQTVNELKALGFHEVLLTDFSIPSSSNIYFDGDKNQALTNAANTIVTSCATGSFAVSFTGNGFALPEGRCRLYLQNVEPSGISAAVEASGVADPLIQLVFVTTLYDTRFEEYSALRPLSSAH